MPIPGKKKLSSKRAGSKPVTKALSGEEKVRSMARQAAIHLMVTSLASSILEKVEKVPMKDLKQLLVQEICRVKNTMFRNMDNGAYNEADLRAYEVDIKVIPGKPSLDTTTVADLVEGTMALNRLLEKEQEAILKIMRQGAVPEHEERLVMRSLEQAFRSLAGLLSSGKVHMHQAMHATHRSHSSMQHLERVKTGLGVGAAACVGGGYAMNQNPFLAKLRMCFQPYGETARQVREIIAEQAPGDRVQLRLEDGPEVANIAKEALEGLIRGDSLNTPEGVFFTRDGAGKPLSELGGTTRLRTPHSTIRGVFDPRTRQKQD